MIVRYSRRAQRDRLLQVEYVEQFSIAAADRLDERIEMHLGLLAEFPEMGREGRVRGTRELRIQHTSLIAIYRMEADHVLVLRIMHVAQDWPGRF